MSRKTIDVNSLVSRANGMHAAPSSTPEGRQGVSLLLEGILMDTDNYRGFQYVLPGGKRVPTEDIHAGNYDETRRRYYAPIA